MATHSLLLKQCTRGIPAEGALYLQDVTIVLLKYTCLQVGWAHIMQLMQVPWLMLRVIPPLSPPAPPASPSSLH